ncbi:MAG: hypothetical protein R3Y47_10880 [Lachnospiraceae bacterium]
MKMNKLVISIVVTVMAIIGIVLGYSWQQSNQIKNVFAGSGFVLVDQTVSADKQILVDANSEWKTGLDDVLYIEDIVGNSIAVDAASFIHYDDSSLSSLSNGVVVDLNDIKTSQVTNYYSLSSEMKFEKRITDYLLSGTDPELILSDFLWKISDSKYMLVSQDMELHFGDEIREAGEFIEISYIDEGVIQIQTISNIWQTVSSDCYVLLENGERVDLSYRNIQDEDGNVLIDFAKIILNSNDNIEVIPMTEEMLLAIETVIPTFDITAEPGEDGLDGASGTDGTNGDTGSTGIQGADGNDGSTGGAGTNGAGGAAGNPGSYGEDGEGNDDTNVLELPVFSITDWSISATECSGTIYVTDDGNMLLSNTEELASIIYLMDMNTNEIINFEEEDFDFSTLESGGYSFHFDGLEPDHNYTLMVEAPINTHLDGAVDYVRNFITKSFWTDSTGVYLESAGSTTTSISVNVNKQSYASDDIGSVTLYFYSNLASASSVNVSNPESASGYMGSYTLDFSDGDTRTVTLSELDPNTTYYVRFITTFSTEDVMPDQTLSIKTLKEMPTVGTPTLTENRDNWGFDITPGSVYDADNGVVEYRYDFYLEGDVTAGSVKAGATPVKTVTSTSLTSMSVAIDGVNLFSQTGYYVQMTVLFYDNERYIEIPSNLSNWAEVSGSQLPSVYFVNSSETSDGDSTAATVTSDWYDQLYGTIIVAPGVDGAQLLLDDSSGYIPYVTIRASGTYYVRYPVYYNESTNLPNDENYLLAYEENGYVYIYLPNKVLSYELDNETGDVTGLKPDTQYRIFVEGDLSEDGTTSYVTDTLVGSCTVTTPSIVDPVANWVVSDTDENSELVVTMSLSAPDGATTDEVSTYTRQMNTISSTTITMTEGTSAMPVGELASITLTNENVLDTLGIDKTEVEDPDNALGEVLEDGITLTEDDFGISTLIGKGSVHITIDEVYDYTVDADNRVNQLAYTSDDDETDTSQPDSSSSDYYIYINEFSIDNDTVDISVGSFPDVVPDEDEGFTELIAKDTDLDTVNDTYYMTPNYANQSQLATTITYYVFDQLDYYDSYTSTTDWTLDTSMYPEGTDSKIIWMASTVVDATTGEGVWLAKVTIDVPTNGVMPKAVFVAQTVDEYYAEQYPDDATTAEELADAYVAGTTTVTYVDSQYYIFFLEDENIESSGHQYMMGWTMTYVDDSGDTKYYPFDASSYQEIGTIPNSEVQDAPRAEPIVYAVPYDSSVDEVEWALYIYDPDQALYVEDEDGNKIYLYELKSATTGLLLEDTSVDGTEDISITAVVNQSEEVTMTVQELIDNTNYIVTLPALSAATTLNVGAKVQWYTDKYTTSEKGLFVEADGSTDTLGTYKDTVGTYSQYGSNIALYTDIFIYYQDLTDFTFAADMTSETNTADRNFNVKLTEDTPSSTSTSVDKYEVEITGPSDIGAEINGFRLTFTDTTTPSKTVVIDKYLPNIDENTGYTYSDTKTTYKFTIYVSSELSELAGSTVSLGVEVLYETGAEGYNYADGNSTVALMAYSRATMSSLSYLTPYSNYRFSSSRALQTIAYTTDMARFGSAMNVSLSGDTLNVYSTRHDETLLPLTENLSLSTSSYGVTAGSDILTVREIGAVKTSGTVQVYDLDNSKIFDLDDSNQSTNSFMISNITPRITYTTSILEVATANSITSAFTLTGATNAYFLIEQKGATTGTYSILVYDNESKTWGNYTGTSTYAAPSEDVLTDGVSSEVSYTNLLADTTYRITAYYLEDEEYKQMFMLDGNNEIINALETATISEPEVTLTSTYYAYQYFNKSLRLNLDISKASDYYYVVYLYEVGNDGSKSFISAIDMGSSTEMSNFELFYYDLSYAFTDHNMTSSGSIAHRGAIFDTSFDTENHILSRGTTQKYLNYGETYQVEVGVYNTGTGPAYEVGYEMETDGDNIIRLSDSTSSKGIATFTVTSAKDTMSISAKQDMTSSVDQDDNLIYTTSMEYQLVTTSRARIIRNGQYTIMVVRTRPLENGGYEYTDVTDYVMIGENLFSKEEILYTSSLSTIRLTNGVDNKGDSIMELGDSFTCYVYGIYDNTNIVTTEGAITNGTKLDRETILAERTLSESTGIPTVTSTGADEYQEITYTDTVSLEDGTSELLASYTLSYTAATVSTGTITVTLNSDGNFDVLLNQPVMPGEITHMLWEVSAVYSDDTTESVLSDCVETNLEDLSSNIYKTATIVPNLSTTDATITAYTVSLRFYTAIYNDEGAISGYQSDTIEIVDSGQGTISQTTEGMQYTITIVPSSNQAGDESNE